MSKEKTTVGWREWIALPDLGIPRLKAKVDTGARTSAIHTFLIDPFEEDGIKKVRIGLHPQQKRTDIEHFAVADIVDERWVSDSGGHKEQRFVIRTRIQVGSVIWPIEVSLTNRDNMSFRMLLGRTAMHHRLIVDPSASYLTGNKPPSTKQRHPQDA